MKKIYMYGSDGIFAGFKTVADDYQLANGETVVAIPQPNVMPVKWNGSTWQNATAEEAAAYQKQLTVGHPAPVAPAAPMDPSEDTQAVNELGLQLAQIQAAQAATTQAVNALGLQLANLKAANPAPQQ